MTAKQADSLKATLEYYEFPHREETFLRGYVRETQVYVPLTLPTTDDLRDLVMAAEDASFDVKLVAVPDEEIRAYFTQED